MQSLVWMLLLLAVSGSWGRIQLTPGAFLKLPDGQNRSVLNNGAATKAAYDPQMRYLYVIGHTADVLHVVDISNPASPQLLDTKNFNAINQGLPNAIKVCRGGLNRDFLAVTFETNALAEKGHVHFYSLKDATNYMAPLRMVKDPVVLDSFDPRSLAWTEDCTQLVVTAEGNPHEINGGFQDPVADVEVLIPSFGTTVDRRSIPLVESKIAAAKLRQVFQVCDSGSATSVSTRNQDLEPHGVHVDSDGMAYVLFSENNGIGKLDLTDPFAEMSYYDLGRKSWAGLQFDGSFSDQAINLENRTVQSFYQPKAAVSFRLDGKTWLATADTGSIRKYDLRTCKFDESIIGRSWRNQFSDGLSYLDRVKLTAELADNTQLGEQAFSKLRTSTDGWDPIFQGYDFVCMFGGRGFSILDPTDMSRAFDSGDDFERVFTGPDAAEAEKAVFNAAVGASNQVISSQFDRVSPLMGPAPSAIATTETSNGTHVLVISNGVAGGLYTYTVTSGPVVTFEGFQRRGQPGLEWGEAYARSDDAVGEPYVTDMLIVENQGQRTLVAVSSYAGALSFYNLQEMP